MKYQIQELVPGTDDMWADLPYMEYTSETFADECCADLVRVSERKHRVLPREEG